VTFCRIENAVSPQASYSLRESRSNLLNWLGVVFNLDLRNWQAGCNLVSDMKKCVPAVVVLVACGLYPLITLAQSSGTNSTITDWTSHHVIYTEGASVQTRLRNQNDLRWRGAWARRNMPLLRTITARTSPSSRQVVTVAGKHRDWAFSMKNGTVGAGQYPAKFGIDLTGTPNCTNDFVVFPLNVNGSATQANLVGLNNLYSNTSNTGFCAGTGPNTLFAYRITKAIPGSPVLSEDGTKIAFVENSATPKFHVLAWKSGQGTVGAPTTPTLIVGVPAAGSGNYTSLSLTGSSNVSLGSPYIDYDNDLAYVTTDTRRLYRIKNVFCTTAACIASPAAPSLDATWTTNPVVVGGNPNVLTAPVLDSNTNNVFLGGSDGKLYGYHAASGTALTGSPIVVGDGTANGGINDPPIVDGSDGLVYVVSGSSASSHAVVYQTTTSFTGTPVTLAIGNGGQMLVHKPAFNDAYYSQAVNGSPLQWFLYLCGVDASNHATLHRVSFNSSRNMTSDATVVTVGAVGDTCSPLTEFLDTTSTPATDRLFVSLVGTTNQVEFFDISSDTAPSGPANPPGPLAEPGGTSGIIIDNAAAVSEATSIYFTTQAKSNNCGTNVYCAVKLTQANLQ